ncbi:MAG: DUF411 domain-containing protein [Candidatus Pacearchaeota archaeon]
MKKKFYVWTGILIVAGLILFFSIGGGSGSYPSLEDYEEDVEVFVSPTCGCCDIHSKHLSSGGLNTEKIVSDQKLSETKSKYNIPRELQSCHTTILGDYFVEGHIPLEAVNKLVEEQPDIAGIAMPGMPSGSPGMPGPKYGDFIVYAVNHEGTYYEFMRI